MEVKRGSETQVHGNGEGMSCSFWGGGSVEGEGGSRTLGGPVNMCFDQRLMDLITRRNKESLHIFRTQ